MQWRISSVLVLLLLVVIAALTLAVKFATNDAVRAQGHQQLEVGGRVFERLLDMRGRRLRDGVQLLASDFGLRDAISSGDVATIRSALLNHGGRIGATDAVLLSMEGTVMASTHMTFVEGEPFPYDQALRAARKRNQYMVIVAWDGLPMLLVDAVVSAPLPIARVVMGFAMDDSFAQELRALSNLQVSFLTVKEGKVGELVSTQPAALRPDLVQWLLNENTPQSAGVNEHGGQRFLEQRLDLSSDEDASGQVLALLQSPLDEALHAFAPLDHDILVIAVAGLLASLLGALLLARTISRPARMLADAAQRIGQGDYQVRVQLRRSDEFGTLASAINLMQAGIAEREHRLAHNALHDHLTGLPNRALAMERLSSAITADRPAAVVNLALDNLASLTTNGGEFTESVLRTVGPILGPLLRPGDTLAHLIGGEYLLILEGVDAQRAVAVADRLQQALLKPQRLVGHDFSLDASIGIAVFPDDGEEADVLVARATIARTDAMAVPGRLQVYQQGRDLIHQREVRLIRDLRTAADNGELLLHYQPKLDLREGKVRQAEALLRWEHPHLGMVSPGEFIALAERTGSIQGLTRWVIGESIRQLEAWNGRGLIVDLSVNVSAEDLLDTDLADRVPWLLAKHGVPAHQLTFEITESAIMREPEAALAVLHRLRDCGISLSVDDFGTGYSSLAHLKRLPVQELKIDQSFVRDLDETSEDAVIVRSTIEMSHNLGLRVVAEGVEHERSLRLLERWRCDTAQGYLISRPLPAEAFEAWIARTHYSPAKEGWRQ